MKRFETGDEQPMKMASNKAFEAIGAKARLSLNADVRGGIINEWCRVTEKGWREDHAMKI